MYFWFLIVSLVIVVVTGADILLLSSLASVSHSRWYGKLALLLAENGHKVVLLDTYKQSFEHANITHRLMEGGYRWLQEVEEMVKTNPDGLNSLVEANSVWETLIMMSDPKFMACDVLLKSEGTKKFIQDYKGKTFDLILADGCCESFYGFVSLFGYPPLIPTGPYLELITADFVGLYDNPSYVPVHLTSLPPNMDFFQRLKNTVYNLMNHYIIRFRCIQNADKLMKEIFGESCADLIDILNNVPLIFTTHSRVLQGAKPLPPNYVPLPGFHVDLPQPLPKSIKDFLDGAEDGAILFSMGSNFKSVLMSEEKRSMFFSVFRNLPQRVIWKLELENGTDIPPNVMITKWLPQNDILGHPNVKLFISHGGLHGTQEAVYHGVPIIGLPIMFDQVDNMDRLERLGVAIRLHYKHLNQQNFLHQIKRILHNPKYSSKMKEVSAAFRDVPMTPKQTALFWIEYVLRNSKNNNKFIRSASLDLEWYQRLLLDVTAFFLLVITGIFIALKIVIKLIISSVRFLSRSSTSGKKKKVS